jgi:GNAT superfamily N-acetyltransferase
MMPAKLILHPSSFRRHPSTSALRYLLSVPLVRAYEDRDQGAVVDAVRTVFEEYGFIWEPDGYNSDLFNVPREYQHGDACFWVGEVDGDVVGCGGVLFFPAVPGPLGSLTDEKYPRVCGADCEVVRLYVHPRGRRMGVGTALFETVCDEARKRDRKVMEIWSDRLLLDAHRMYERYGAVKVGQRICPPPDETPEWGMYLLL